MLRCILGCRVIKVERRHGIGQLPMNGNFTPFFTHYFTHRVHLCIIVHPLVVSGPGMNLPLYCHDRRHSCKSTQSITSINIDPGSWILDICGSGTILMSIIVGIDGLCLQTRNGVKFLHKHHWSDLWHRLPNLHRSSLRVYIKSLQKDTWILLPKPYIH